MHVITVDGNVKTKDLQLLTYLIMSQIFAKTLSQPGQIDIYLCAFKFLLIFIAISRHLKLRIQLLEILHRKCQSLVTALGINSLLIT